MECSSKGAHNISCLIPINYCLCFTSAFRFTDAQHHKFLLEFIKTVAKCYKDQDRAKDFILDLLHLDVPGLFVTDTEGSTSTLQSDILAASVPDEFSNFLADYIQRNNLQDTILGEVETIWVCIAVDFINCFAGSSTNQYASVALPLGSSQTFNAA